jgi:hypothetical protein
MLTSCVTGAATAVAAPTAAISAGSTAANAEPSVVTITNMNWFYTAGATLLSLLLKP